MSGTSWSFTGGLNRSQERHLKNRIKKVFGEKIAESLQQHYNGDIRITTDSSNANLFGDICIGDDYESALDYLNKKLYKLRKEKMKRLL